jgi:imidazolonepropionase-like amidohydrolase
MPAFSASHTLYAPCATSKPGKLGVVEEGALADLLLVDGNPLENIKLIEDPDKNFLLIMKDGAIYKNILPK